MALRYVKPLKRDDWVVLEELKKGPSPEQREAVRNAIQKAKHLGMPKVEDLD